MFSVFFIGKKIESISFFSENCWTHDGNINYFTVLSNTTTIPSGGQGEKRYQPNS
jgi:hypothetical protein